MTGLELQNNSLITNQGVCDAAVRWTDGDGIPGRDASDENPSKRLRANELEVTFDSRFGPLSRKISSTMKLKDLYKLAYRGLKARALIFQLSTDLYGPLAPSPEATVTSRNISNGDHITIRIAEDEPDSTANGSLRGPEGRHGDLVLVKVFESMNTMFFATG